MRKLITLGLTVAAVFAMSAMTASAASAYEFFGEAETYTGHDVKGDTNAFTAFNGVVECNHETTSYHAEISEPASTLTVEPTYESCTSGGGTVDEVTMNGCDYVFHVNEEVGADHFRGTADLECPEGQQVEVDVRNPEGVLVCTISIEKQGNFGPITFTHETTDDALKIEGTLEGIKAHRKGLCTAGATQETKVATLHFSTTFTGLTVG